MAKKYRPPEPSHKYVMLRGWMTNTEAWRDLDCIARCIYIELSSRYAGRGTNNGRIPCSLREIAAKLHCSKQTAMRALDRLQDHGFIVRMKRGNFNFKLRHAAEWRLTEFVCDVTGDLPTKDFTRWKKQTPVPSENSPGFRDGTARVS